MFAILNNHRYNESGRIRLAYIVLLGVAVVLGLLLLVIVYGEWWLPRWDAAKHGLVLVDRYVQSPRWSKDGRTLFYICPKGRETLRAYDVTTGRKRGYDVPVREPYDISPDGKSVVYLQSLHRLAILSLDTGRARTIHRTADKIVGEPFWLSGNVIVFHKEHNPGVFVLNPSSRNVNGLRNKQLGLGLSYVSYGPGVIYIGKDKHFYYHNLETGKSRCLKTQGIRTDGGGNRFYFLSDRCLIYAPIYDLPMRDARILNIRTGKSGVIRKIFAEGYGCGAISPDMSRYSVWLGGKGEWAVPTLYVGTFSNRVTKRFANFGCAGDNSRHSAERGSAP